MLAQQLHGKSILALVERQTNTGAVFVEWSDSQFKYSALLEDISRCCGLFDFKRLNRGDRVLILTHREREAITLFIAALLDGLVPVMLTPDTPSTRAKTIADLTEAALVVTDQPRLINEPWLAGRSAIGIHDGGGPLAKVLTSFRQSGKNSNGSFQQVLASIVSRRPRCDSKPDDLAYILFTSGTTSAPKGVMVTHRNLFSHLETISRAFSYSADSGIFNGMVLAHADGIVQGPLLALANGGRLIRPRPFTPQTMEPYLNMARAHRATHFLSVPTIYSLIERYAQHDDYFDGEEFVALVSVAAKLEDKLWKGLEERFRRPLFNMYGLTETVTGGLFAGPHPQMGPLGTIGKPIDVDVRLVRSDGTDAPEGEPGEIWLRGENVSPGYYKAPVETAERYSGEWLKTADVAIRTPEGAYRMVGRLKTIIMYGGFLIRPEEIDEALLMHPSVVEASTVSLSDPDFGEIPVSAVVLDTMVAEEELTAHCSRLLEAKKVPRRIIALPTIPRGDAGKTQINALREILKDRVKVAATAAEVSSVEATILDVASKTFRTPLAALSLESSPETVPLWDSFAHITLIHNVETRLGVRLPTAEIVTINSLRKLAETVRQLS